MLMLWCTKILKPPPGRIGSIGKMKMPRAVPIPQFSGFVIGAILMMFTLTPFVNLSGVFIGMLAGGALGAWIVGVRPWKGENILKVIWIKGRSITQTARNICPGSAMPVKIDRSGVEFCGSCGLVCEIESFAGLSVAKQHEWKRTVYIGVQRVTPFSGIVHYRRGSVEVPA